MTIGKKIYRDTKYKHFESPRIASYHHRLSVRKELYFFLNGVRQADFFNRINQKTPREIQNQIERAKRETSGIKKVTRRKLWKLALD